MYVHTYKYFLNRVSHLLQFVILFKILRAFTHSFREIVRYFGCDRCRVGECHFISSKYHISFSCDFIEFNRLFSQLHITISDIAVSERDKISYGRCNGCVYTGSFCVFTSYVYFSGITHRSANKTGNNFEIFDTTCVFIRRTLMNVPFCVRTRIVSQILFFTGTICHSTWRLRIWNNCCYSCCKKKFYLSLSNLFNASYEDFEATVTSVWFYEYYFCIYSILFYSVLFTLRYILSIIDIFL